MMIGRRFFPSADHNNNNNRRKNQDLIRGGGKRGATTTFSCRLKKHKGHDIINGAAVNREIDPVSDKNIAYFSYPMAQQEEESWVSFHHAASPLEDCRCWTCHATDGKLLICDRCRHAMYCSKECQIKDWHLGHHHICSLAAAAQGRASSSPPTDVVAMELGIADIIGADRVPKITPLPANVLNSSEYKQLESLFKAFDMPVYYIDHGALPVFLQKQATADPAGSSAAGIVLVKTLERDTLAGLRPALFYLTKDNRAMAKSLVCKSRERMEQVELQRARERKKLGGMPEFPPVPTHEPVRPGLPPIAHPPPVVSVVPKTKPKYYGKFVPTVAVTLEAEKILDRLAKTDFAAVVGPTTTANKRTRDLLTKDVARAILLLSNITYPVPSPPAATSMSASAAADIKNRILYARSALVHDDINNAVVNLIAALTDVSR